MTSILQEILNWNDTISKSAGKTRQSRKELLKSLDGAKKNYSKFKSLSDSLMAQDRKLQEDLSSAKDGLSSCKKDMQSVHDVLRSMDLLGSCDDAIVYDNSDVGYIVDGKEHHLNLSDDGEFELIPMGTYRKSKKEEPKEESKEEEDDEEQKERFGSSHDELLSLLEASLG